MYKRIKEKYGNSLEKIKNFFGTIRNHRLINRALTDILEGIENNHKNSSWVNVAVLITNILGFAAYCVISPVLAEYQREKGIRIFSIFAIVFIITIIIWELICLAGYDRLRALSRFFNRAGERALSFCQKYFDPVIKVIGFLFAIFVITIVFLGELISRLFHLLKNLASDVAERHPRRVKWIFLFMAAIMVGCLHFVPDVTYCTSLVEIYGMPTKFGKELKGKEEREKCAAYWKIEDYSWRNFMVLTYVEPYKQLEVMRENSTAYGMSFFQPTACIKIHYKKDKGKYLSFNQKSFEVAKNNGFREPIEISYYSSNHKPILKLEKNEYGKFDITRYSSADMPQLLNSTLLYVQNENSMENSMISQQIEVTYNAEGLPETRRFSPNIYNANGINGEYYVYDQNRRLTTLYYLDINGEFVCNKQGIMMIDFQYEDNGNLHSIRYYGGEDRTKKMEGYQGVFCERFAYDSYGNLKERSQRDRNENLCSDVNGVCTYRYSYDHSGNSTLIKEEFLGFDGEPVMDNHFYSTSVGFKLIDEIGDRKILILMDELDPSVTVIEEPENSFGAEQQRDQTAFQMGTQNQTEETDFLEQGKWQAQLQTTGTTVSKQKNKQTDETIYTEQSESQIGQTTPALQESKQHMEIPLDEEADIIRNYVSICYMIDRDGCVSEKSYCDSKEEPVACKDGYAIIHYDYDKLKRIICERYLDNKSNPCCVKEGYAVVRKSYDSDQSDNIKLIEYLINDKELVRNRELGYAYVEYTRTPEDKNKLICKRYFDEERNPALLPGLGYSMVEEYYDERNFLIWEAYYAKKEGKYERVCRDDCGVSEIWYEYEDSGNRIRELYKDVDKKLVNRSDTGYAAVYWKYEGGQLVDCHYERSQNQMLRAAVDRNTGIAGIKYTYEGGKKVREEYYDTEENPSFRTDIGCAAQVFEYDERGRICAESYYDLNGEAVLRKDTGYALAVYQDNEYGQRISVRFYDTDKQLVISTVDHCAGYDYTYDSTRNEKKVKYIGLDGKMMTRRDLGYAQVCYKYDADGNITEGRFYDTKGKPAVRKERGYAYYTREYDENGNWLESCYYSAEDDHVLRQDKGYFRIVNEYNDDRKCISQRFYGTDGKQPVISTEYGCAGFQYQYDDIYDNKFDFEYEESEKGVRKTTTYIGLDGRPMIRKELGYAKVESVYDMEDHEISAIFYDTDGNITVCKEGGYAAFRNIYENGNWVKSQFFDVAGNLVSRNDTGYAVIINEYDEYGQRVRESYYDENNERTISTKYHCAGWRFEYDEKGNRIHLEYLDTENQMMVRRDLGFAQMKEEYDNVGNKVSEAYFDTKGQPAVWKEGGYASYREEYESGKWLETRYYDKAGNLTLRNNKGYAIIKNEYDEYGQRITQSYYDASELLKPVISKEYHCAGFQYKYDEMGNQVFIGYMGLDGNLMIRRDLGYAQVIMKYDYLGNKTREEYSDIEGNPAIDKEGGYSYYENHYDKWGRVKDVEYFIIRNVRNKAGKNHNKTEKTVAAGKENIDETTKEGELVLRKDTGYAKVEYKYDEFGQEKYCFYYGTDGKPVVSTKYLCAGIEYAYDEKGNKTDIYYLGGPEKERIVRRDLGVVHIQKEYDILGNLKRELYFDNDGPTTYMGYGYASCENSYENGLLIETRYLDVMGDPVINGETGYAIVQYEYDEFGQCISEAYYVADDQPMISKEKNCAGCRYAYDEAGNQTEKYYVDKHGDPMIQRDLGYAHLHSEYDECGNEIRAAYYDADDKPAIWKEGGNAACEFQYDDRGNCVEWRYFDQQGNSMLRSDTGYATVRYEYDNYDQCIAESYYDTEGNLIFRKDNPYAGRRFSYDERGNQTKICYIGLDGQPVTRKDMGYAQIRSEYDRFNNKTKEIYLDIYSEPVVRQELGYAQTQWEYNEIGKVSKVAYFNAEGQAVMRKDGGYAYCKFYYHDDEEYYEEIQYFDVNNNLVVLTDEGYAIIQHFYDEFGQYTGVNYRGINREQVTNLKKYCASISYEYDEKGNNTYIWYWNSDGEVAECQDTGIAMEHNIYDEYNNLIAKEYYGIDPEDDTLMQRKIHKGLGYACVNYVYDRNARVRTEYLDAEGNYIVPKGVGYAVYECEYDDLWQVSWKSYYDAEEELTNYVDNIAAMIEYTYDDWGYIEERIYYDKMGNVCESI